MNTQMNTTAKRVGATGEPTSRRLKRLADELAELLVDEQGGQVFLEVYPAGHEKGVFLRAIASPKLTIPLSEFRGSPRPGLADFREVAQSMRDLEDDVHDLARAVTVLDDYTGLALDRGRWDDGEDVSYRLSLEAAENLRFLSGDARRRAEYFRACFTDAAVYPFTADGVQAVEDNTEGHS